MGIPHFNLACPQAAPLTVNNMLAPPPSRVKVLLSAAFTTVFPYARPVARFPVAPLFGAVAAQADTPLRVRIGLNAGEPIAEEDDLFGTAVIVAARIAAKAEGEEIMVSDTVRGLVAGKGFLFSDRGDVVLRGFEDPVRLYEVRWQEG